MHSAARSVSLAALALAAFAVPPAAAQAGCVPGVTSDVSANTCIGTDALKNNSGSLNTASGFAALNFNTTGNYNTATGYNALLYNTTGSYNTASGLKALYRNTTGSNNIALGFEAGKNLNTGSNNIAIGSPGVTADANTIRIGTAGTHTRAFMAGIRTANVTNGLTVLVDANGQLGVPMSSMRYKQDVQPMGDASSALMQLRPVTFRYKDADEDGTRPLQYGLIAEEVAKAMPDLAVYNADGTPESVAYQVLPSLLLNEYQKQNRELAETKAKLAAMQSEMDALKLMVSRLASAQPAVHLATGN